MLAQAAQRIHEFEHRSEFGQRLPLRSADCGTAVDVVREQGTLLSLQPREQGRMIGQGRLIQTVDGRVEQGFEQAEQVGLRLHQRQ